MAANVGGLRTAIRRAELAADKAKLYESAPAAAHLPAPNEQRPSRG
jgi:hypothetical protein